MMSPVPVRLTESAAVKLPRLGLIALLLAYGLPGLFGRDPWRTDDAVGFGVMWTMAQGGWQDWLIPNVAGAIYLDDGPLFFWVGALLIKLFGGWFPPHEVARLATLGALAVAASSIWYAVYLLGRRSEAQPQQFAFGGQPNSKDYGRALADGALLICLATLGLLVRAHETSAEIPQFALLCFAIYALARSLDKPATGALSLGLAIAGLVLVRGPAVALVPLTTAAVLVARTPAWRALGSGWFAIVVATALVPCALWLVLVRNANGGAEYLAAWWSVQRVGVWASLPSTWLYYLRNLPWFAWPAWPLAAWAAWTWRGHRGVPQFAIPGTGLIVTLLYLAFGEATSDTAMVTVVPHLVVLAAFALPALRRGTANLIDWFALMMFSVFAALIWLGWIAMMTGTPPKIANNFAKLAPGFVPAFSWLPFVVALAATIAWAWLVRWRVFSRPEVLWRTVVLSAGGVTIVWVLFMTLLLPYVDYLKTYRYVSARIARIVPAGDCVRAEYVGLAQRASLAYFDRLEFGSQCHWMLRHQNVSQTLPPVDPARWQKVWEGRRNTDRYERFSLYRRVEAAPVAKLPEPPAAAVSPADTGLHDAESGQADSVGQSDPRPAS